MGLDYNRYKKNFIHRLHEAFEADIDIYNQASLKRIQSLNEYTDHQYNDDLSIIFQLKGEVEGQIICSIKLNKDKDSIHLKSLFTESMNILLGKFLTDLEEKIGLMSVISVPELITRTKRDSLIKTHSSRYKLNLITSYELLTLKDSHTCHIHILANQKGTKEV